MYSIPYCISIDMFRIHLFYEICGGVVLMSVGHVKNVLLIEYSSGHGQLLEDVDVPIICFVQLIAIVCRPLHVIMTASFR